MGKKTKKQYNKDIPVSTVLPESVTRDDLHKIIVKALLEYDQRKKELEKNDSENELKDRHELIGYKDYSNRKGLSRLVLTFVNRVRVFFRILFMPKKKIKGDFATTSLMKFAVALLFSATKWALWVFSFGAVLSYPVSLLLPNASRIELIEYPSYFCFGIIAFIFAQLFIIASIEIENMEDRNYVVDIFAAVAAIVAIIVSIVLR